MLLRFQTGPIGLANKTDEDSGYKKSFVPNSWLDILRNARIRVKEWMSSSVSFSHNTRVGTIIPSRALLLLVACYHDQNHTHYFVEVIEVVIGGRCRWAGGGDGDGRCHLLAAGTQFPAIAALILATLAWPYATRLCTATILKYEITFVVISLKATLNGNQLLSHMKALTGTFIHFYV